MQSETEIILWNDIAAREQKCNVTGDLKHSQRTIFNDSSWTCHESCGSSCLLQISLISPAKVKGEGRARLWSELPQIVNIDQGCFVFLRVWFTFTTARVVIPPDACTTFLPQNARQGEESQEGSFCFLRRP